jgi:hypothetical protein
VDRIEMRRGTRTPRWARLSALVAALVAAAPAAAAPRPTAAPARPAPTVPAKPEAPTPPAPPTDEAALDATLDPAWRFGPALGFEFGTGDVDFDGLSLRLDAERAWMRLSPLATLSFLGSLAMTHASGSKTVSMVVDPFTGRSVSGTVEWDANIFEVIPGVRLAYAVSPSASLFADTGLGLAYTAGHDHVSTSIAASSPESPTSTGLGGVVRLAGGIVFNPSSALRIAIEPLGLRLRFGNGPGSGLDIAASLSYRL